jgi:hypothetical protein
MEDQMPEDQTKGKTPKRRSARTAKRGGRTTAGTPSRPARATSKTSKSASARKPSRSTASKKPGSTATATTKVLRGVGEVPRRVSRTVGGAARAIPKALSQAATTTARAGRRAGERVGEAAADTAAGIAANSKYLIAGALVGAAAGAAFEASQKRSDSKGKSKDKKGRKRSPADRSETGFRDLASRAIDAAGGFAAQVGELAIQGFEAIRGGQDDRNNGHDVDDQAAPSDSDPQDEPRGENRRKNKSRASESGDETQVSGASDDQEDVDEPGIEIVRGQMLTENPAEEDGDDEDQPTGAGADEDVTSEDSDESGVMISSRKRRGNEVDPEIERSWSA